jgi:hypothetical protein
VGRRQTHADQSLYAIPGPLGAPVVRKNKESLLCDLPHQAIFVMQATEQRCLRNTETSGQLVSVAAGRNAIPCGFRKSRT